MKRAKKTQHRTDLSNVGATRSPRVVSLELEMELENVSPAVEKRPSAPDTLGTVHRLAMGLHRAGAFDKATMRAFDEMCLTAVLPMGAQAIRDLREASGVSQAVLARVLNVTTNAVGQWERGEKRPSGSALKLLTLVREKGLSSVM